MADKKQWQNRIVDHGDEDPGKLLPNPQNWRIHSGQQQKALGAVLDEVGWVQDVILNRRTGHLVDGHLRVALAASRGERVPVVYIDVSEAEERLILATIDPLSAMAGTDEELLAALRGAMLPEHVDIAELCGAAPVPQAPGADESGQLAEQFQVLVDCGSESRQSELLERLNEEGWKCRALLS